MFHDIFDLGNFREAEKKKNKSPSSINLLITSDLCVRVRGVVGGSTRHKLDLVLKYCTL